MEHSSMILTLEIIKTVAITGTAIITIITLITGYSQYKLMVKQKRCELYELYRKKMKENESISQIINYLETNNKEIINVPRVKRYLFLGFFEDIALLINSKLIKPEIAHYMFAYYAIQCWNNELFWNGINRDSHYWRVFKEFVEKMKKLEENKLTIPENKEIKFKI
jgi:hypothetical protein